MSNYQQKQLKYWSLEALIVLTIIFLCYKLSFLFQPLKIFMASIFTPILVSGILYYLLHPVVKLLTKLHIKKHYISRTFATLIVFVVIALIIFVILDNLIPELTREISNLISNLPSFSRNATKTVTKFTKHGWLKHLPIKQYLTHLQNAFSLYGKHYMSHFSSNVSPIISTITTTIINLITIPIMLFYMLTDGYKFQDAFIKFLPKKHQNHAKRLMQKMSKTISKYIDGQMIECLFVGTFTMIGFFIIKQPYALPLGMFAGMCVIMPYVGPYIGIAPSLLVALTIAPKQLIYVIIVTIIVQQIDGNFIYPNVIGKALNIHPLTIIIILLAVGNMFGLIGMILAVPVYAIAKTVVLYTHHLYQLAH